MPLPQWLRYPVDFFVTLFTWFYFTLGYFILFFPFYLFSFFFAPDREKSFQKITHRYFKSFFFLLKTITPGLSFQIDADVYRIRSSIIVCNHLSYLDPLLLISLYEKQKTIVKTTFLKVPFLGWVVKTAGYLFSTRDETFTSLMADRLMDLNEFLLGGGNIFIFPEGTRSRDGRIGRLNKGAFTIARHHHVPIEVLRIDNTNILFQPGTFLIKTCIPNTITVKHLGRLEPGDPDEHISIQSQLDRVRQWFST